MSASEYLIGVNDEHGLDPPTNGKRTPVMPYLDRSIYENEFNRPAKILFAVALLRSGFRTVDIHPELRDIPITTRVNRTNISGANMLVTFAYNAFGSGHFFNSVSGMLVYFSDRSAYAEKSRLLSEDIYTAVAENSCQTNGRGVGILPDVGVLRSVRCPSALIEAGFMTNLREARLMLDPDWQKSIAYAAAIGICNYTAEEYVGEGSPNVYPTVMRGSENEYVKIAQYLLTYYGYATDPDGIFGSVTAERTAAFQSANGLDSDGIIGRQTWSRLVLPSPSAYVLRIGSTGTPVQYLQYKLLSKLYPLNPDGIFGEETENAVRHFQTESGLEPDGIVGPLTFSALARLSSPRNE